MSYTVSDSEKERLYDEYGKPPKRDDPLDVGRDNLVYVCTIGGPLYDVQKGRAMKTGLTREDVKESRSIATHHGTVPDGETFVNVRYGTATMECCYVPEAYVLEVLAEDATWSNKERQHVPA